MEPFGNVKIYGQSQKRDTAHSDAPKRSRQNHLLRLFIRTPAGDGFTPAFCIGFWLSILNDVTVSDGQKQNFSIDEFFSFSRAREKFRNRLSLTVTRTKITASNCPFKPHRSRKARTSLRGPFHRIRGTRSVEYSAGSNKTSNGVLPLYDS